MQAEADHCEWRTQTVIRKDSLAIMPSAVFLTSGTTFWRKKNK